MDHLARKMGGPGCKICEAHRRREEEERNARGDATLEQIIREAYENFNEKQKEQDRVVNQQAPIGFW